MKLLENIDHKLKNEITDALPTIMGWCDLDKALKIASCVLSANARLAVEIGVYGGSSLLPMAMAIRTLPQLEVTNPLDNPEYRKVVGIDPWEAAASLEGMKEEANIAWWTNHARYEDVYNHCCAKIDEYRLNNYTQLVKAKSDDVVQTFADGSIDLLHIDGNHGEATSFADATNYLPKVRSGGLIVFDDVWWCEKGEVTTRKAWLFLLENCYKIDMIGKEKQCLVLEKR